MWIRISWVSIMELKLKEGHIGENTEKEFTTDCFNNRYLYFGINGKFGFSDSPSMYVPRK